MGELHLEIYVERMRREYNVACTTGKPRVAFRETITQRAEFNYTHRKQTGGQGQFARVIGHIEPMEKDDETGKDVEFENMIMGGTIPEQYIPGVENVRTLWSFFTLITKCLSSLGIHGGYWEGFTLWKPDYKLQTCFEGWIISPSRFFWTSLPKLHDLCIPWSFQGS